MGRERLNALEILRALPRTNCGDCRQPTCLAFANLVAQGRARAEACPWLEGGGAAAVRGLAWAEPPAAVDHDDILDDLTRRVREVDFAAVAGALGARLDGGCLVFTCLGREFAVDPRGRLRSACHANFWVLVPLLDSIARAARGAPRRPVPPARAWKRFDELRETLSATDFFSTSVEGALRGLADADAALLADLLEMFGGRHADLGFGAALSILLYPHPRVPLLVCYWPADDEFESKLRVFFDRSAPEYLSVESLYIVTTGIVEMVERLFARHYACGGA
jgi:hypothetical protein